MKNLTRLVMLVCAVAFLSACNPPEQTMVKPKEEASFSTK